MLSRRLMIGGLSGIAIRQVTGHAWANDLSTRPVTFVIPFSPGGGIDVVSRAMAPLLQKRLGTPILIENRVGAGGTIAATSVAKSAADGHTLFAAPSAFSIYNKVYKALPFDTLKDFQAVSLLMRSPYFLVVNPAVPANTVGELVELLKRKPGEYSYAHSGVGGGLQLAAEMFQTMSGTKMNGVSYRGAPPAFNDVVAGHIPLMFVDTGTALTQIAEGKVRALGVSSTVRIPATPEVPTISEAGIPGFDAVGWLLICAPAGTPSPIVDKLSYEIMTAASTPDVKDLIARLGNLPVHSPSPSELQRFLANEIQRWGDLVEKVGAARSQ